MTSSSRVARGPLILLGLLAVLFVTAGLLPWLTGGSGWARGLASPMVAVGLLAGYAVIRAPHAGPAAPRAGVRRTSGRPARCEGCACGPGNCADA
ncbi:MAG TPA: hypothetical protein VLJ59_10360 [Mycobacteriales bacterium]|nr:hypothetical protein [Mycobacteriales bacterium]